MNIALATITIFAFLLPGIGFRRFYFAEEFSKQYFKEQFSAIIVTAVLPSLIFHTVWYFGSDVFSYKINLDLLSQLFSRGSKEDLFQNIEEFASEIAVYHSSLLFISSFSGYLLRKVVRYTQLDRKLKLLRFQNHWHYLINGEFYDFPRSNVKLVKNKVEDIELVYVDALIDTAEGAFLYNGILVDYELSSDGGLEALGLTQVQRRNFTYDKEPADEAKRSSRRFYPIEGHNLILKYSHIINLNFTYYTLEFDDQGELSVQMLG